jgi:hypothetical protein
MEVTLHQHSVHHSLNVWRGNLLPVCREYISLYCVLDDLLKIGWKFSDILEVSLKLLYTTKKILPYLSASRLQVLFYWYLSSPDVASKSPSCNDHLRPLTLPFTMTNIEFVFLTHHRLKSLENLPAQLPT